MCMEVISCQSDRSPERLMISHTPSIVGTSHQPRWENICGGNSPSFWGEFCKTLPSQNGIFLAFQNCGILDLPQLYICQYYRYGSEKLWETLWEKETVQKFSLVNLRGQMKGR